MRPTTEQIRGLPPVAFWRNFSSAAPGVLAAAVAYNLFFALVPAFVALVAGASFFGRSEEAQQQTQEFLEQALPSQAAEFIVDGLRDAWETTTNAQGLVVGVAIIISLWVAARGVITIQRVLTHIEEMEDPRPWWLKRLIATALTVGAMIILLLTSVLIVAGARVASWLENVTDVHWLLPAWDSLSLPLGVLSLLGFLAALYRWGPPQRLPGMWLAAVLAALGTVAVSLGFRFYIENSGALGSTFAAFFGVAVLLLWLFLVAYVILLSAAVGASWARRRSKQPLPQSHVP